MLMIKNEREYLFTKKRTAELEAALTEVEEAAESSAGGGAEADDLEQFRSSHLRLIGDMQSQLAEYDELRAGEVKTFRVTSLADLPRILIRARLARGLSAAQLAKLLEWKVTRLERYEELEYLTASWEKIAQVAEVLGVEFEGGARLVEESKAPSIEELIRLFENELEECQEETV